MKRFMLLIAALLFSGMALAAVNINTATKEELEALQLGSVHLLAPSTAKFAPLGVKEFEALDLPYLFKDEGT